MPDLPPVTPSYQASEVRTFDLAEVKAGASCTSSSGGQIVVCAQDSKLHRLRPLAQNFKESGPPKAEIVLPDGATLGINAQSQSVGGFNSNRVMVGVKLPF